MKVDIISTDEFICERCNEDSEFLARFEGNKEKLCPYCAVEEVCEVIN